MFGNCLFYALRKWRANGYSGWVLMRKSPRGWWPHFAYSADGVNATELNPLHPIEGLPLPPPLFRGVERTFRIDNP